MILKLGMQHQGHKLYKIYINGDVDLDLFYGKVKLSCQYIRMGKTVTKLFNGQSLQQRTRLTE